MLKLIKFLILMVFLSIFAYISDVAADVYTCGTNGVDNSCTPSGLNTLIASASDGDIINIAQATHSWSSYATIDKRITISGGGSCINCGTSSPSGSWPTQLTVNNNTAFVIKAGSGTGIVRLTGIYFYGPTNGTYACNNTPHSTVYEHQNNLAQYRVDNNKFENTNGGGDVATYGENAYGVFDHDFFTSTVESGHSFYIQRCASDGHGHNSWDDDVDWGTTNFVFIENCTFLWDTDETDVAGSAATPGIIDVRGGGRLVFRYSYIENAFVLTHGAAVIRGGYAVESYENTYNYNNPKRNYPQAHLVRGGPLLFYNNNVGGASQFQHAIRFWVERVNEDDGAPYYDCDGTEDHDGNGSPNGYPCLDQPGRGKASGNTLFTVQSQKLSPIYIWNNTLDTLEYCQGTKEYAHICNSHPNYVVDSTDYYFCTDSSCAPAGYTPYTYPHPLTTRMDATRPNSPQNLIAAQQ